MSKQWGSMSAPASGPGFGGKGERKRRLQTLAVPTMSSNIPDSGRVDNASASSNAARSDSASATMYQVETRGQRKRR